MNCTDDFFCHGGDKPLDNCAQHDPHDGELNERARSRSGVDAPPLKQCALGQRLPCAGKHTLRHATANKAGNEDLVSTVLTNTSEDNERTHTCSEGSAARNGQWLSSHSATISGPKDNDRHEVEGSHRCGQPVMSNAERAELCQGVTVEHYRT